MEDKSVNELFSSRVQYEIPVYQRRYVWQEANWQQLWVDIEHHQATLDKNPRPHFTGIIITRKKENGVGYPKYEIIDGQQRLTTFQIILCVIRDICKGLINQNIAADAYNLDEIATETDRHIKNVNFSTNCEDRNTQNKLLPTMYDRAAFQALVDNKENDSDLLIYQAYHYFKEQIGNYIGNEHTKIQSLFDSITQDFSLVQIDLNPDDEPEKIFASLNATGRMLYEVDYLRNDLFLRAGKVGEKERQRLYDEYWIHFENHERYWDSEKLEKFLEDFLKAKLRPACFQGPHGRTMKAFDLYQTEYCKEKGKSLDNEFKELMRYSEIYRGIDTHARAQFYEEFNITDWHSFILWLIAEKKINEGDLEQLFHVLESYTVRRMVCYGTKYKSPNTATFLSTIRKEIRRKIRNQGNYSIEEFIRLLGGNTRSNQWPDDDHVKNYLRRSGGSIDKDLMRYILYRIKFQDQVNPSTEELGRFVRQYVMPLRWEGEKLLPVGKEYRLYNDLFREDYKADNPRWTHRPYEDGLLHKSEPYKAALRLALDRKDMVHSIGNLTIVDPSRPVKTPSQWDVEQIQEETERLSECFCEIWPSANSFIEEITGKSDEEITGKSDEIIKSESYLFMTYGGIRSFSNIKPTQYNMEGTEGNDNEDVILKKDNILFAFPRAIKRKWPLDPDIARKKFTPVPKQLAKQITDDTLSGAKKSSNYMKLVTRAGHTLCGVVKDFDRYCIYMQVDGYNEQTMIVYRHGVYRYDLRQRETRQESQSSVVKLHEMIDSKSYVFITDQDKIKLSRIKPYLDKVTGFDKRSMQKTVKKEDILFAYPSDFAMGDNLSIERQLQLGTVKWFNDDKGYGFIQKTNGKDVFFHHSAIQAEGFRTLSNGQQVEFKVVQDKKGPAAENVVAFDGTQTSVPNDSQHNLILMLELVQEKNVNVVTYCRDLIEGVVAEFDEIVIYLKIDKHMVIVFNHGVHKLSTSQFHKSKVISVDSEGNGFIEFSEHNKKKNSKGIFVSKNQVGDMPLKINQKVKFRLEYTAGSLQAIDVKALRG